jgi:hypothetical protein
MPPGGLDTRAAMRIIVTVIMFVAFAPSSFPGVLVFRRGYRLAYGIPATPGVRGLAALWSPGD